MKRQKTNESVNKLYLVGTPIGNYDDMTIRAINTLKSVDLIYCEDTRITGQLLNHFEIKTKMRSYNVITEEKETNEVIENLLAGKNIAIVSDAGMPSVSDPGFLACREAIRNDIDVCVVPGVSASLTALVSSGISARTFYFQGFLNSRHNQRVKDLEALKERKETIIIYEAPHRIKETLTDMLDVLGDRYICLSRELTKKYEEHLRGNISEILEVVDSLKGEMVIVVEGAKETSVQIEFNDKTVLEHFNYYLSQGFDEKEAMKKVAKDRGVSKSIIYQEIKRK